MGLLDPDTRDGRVIFFLPWMNYALAGTTDTECNVTDQPSPSEAEVNFILEEISSYLSPEIQGRCLVLVFLCENGSSGARIVPFSFFNHFTPV